MSNTIQIDFKSLIDNMPPYVEGAGGPQYQKVVNLNNVNSSNSNPISVVTLTSSVSSKDPNTFKVDKNKDAVTPFLFNVSLTNTEGIENVKWPVIYVPKVSSISYRSGLWIMQGVSNSLPNSQPLQTQPGTEAYICNTDEGINFTMEIMKHVTSGAHLDFRIHFTIEWQVENEKARGFPCYIDPVLQVGHAGSDGGSGGW
ncbi:MAG TPA: hypothetical protein DCR93_31320 [Cytophagales bacterium]|nr:hypothetical protein [Cytophagales bacterium]HAP63793.1 hypothetical protein [Cytophagales bacterium]